jgi:hypothetical protein
LNENERRDRAFSVVHTPSNREIGVRDKSFTFDKVFGVESTQVKTKSKRILIHCKMIA